MSKSVKNEEVDHLLDAILSLESREEAYNFFEDLCTVNEIISMAQRLEVAKLLVKKVKYTDIVKQTGASTATISRVNRALNYGNDGYEIVINRNSEEK
mgnify:CR=1 FL=1